MGIPCLDYSPDSVLECEGSSAAGFELQNQSISTSDESISASHESISASHESISASHEMKADVLDIELVGLKFTSSL